MGVFVDLVGICDPANPYQVRLATAAPNQTIADLQLEVAPLGGPNSRAPGTYRLTLRIAAANSKPIEKIFEFTHTGLWYVNDAQMRNDCLAVKLI